MHALRQRRESLQGWGRSCWSRRCPGRWRCSTPLYRYFGSLVEVPGETEAGITAFALPKVWRRNLMGFPRGEALRVLMAGFARKRRGAGSTLRPRRHDRTRNGAQACYGRAVGGCPNAGATRSHEESPARIWRWAVALGNDSARLYLFLHLRANRVAEPTGGESCHVDAISRLSRYVTLTQWDRPSKPHGWCESFAFSRSDSLKAAEEIIL